MADDEEDRAYVVIPEEDFKAAMQEMMDGIVSMLQPGWGCTMFFVSPIKDDVDSMLHYVSTLDKEENIALLKQWLNRSVQ